MEAVQTFALSVDQFGDSLKDKAGALGLVITVSAKNNTGRDSRRIYSGIPAKARKIIKDQLLSGRMSRSLFRFNRRQDGLFHASPANADAMDEFLKYRRIFRAYLSTVSANSLDSAVPSVRRAAKTWSEDDTTTLVTMRCANNPSTFRQIALALNRTHEVVGTVIDRPFEANDCKNKWCRMFPSAMDANKTLEYLKSLQKKWPGLVFKTTTEKFKDTSRPPTLISLHVVWPWAADLMSTLSPSQGDVPIQLTRWETRVFVNFINNFQFSNSNSHSYNISNSIIIMILSFET